MDAIEAIRTSPAGVPSVRLELAHESTQIEAGHPRKVQCRMRVAVVGAQVDRVAGLSIGDSVVIRGFLARASYRSEWPVLHATELKVI